MDIYYLLLYFFIYAFFGWVLEVLYNFASEGHFTNRGMLNGPYCPIYAFGAICMLLFLEPYLDHFWATFFGAIFFGTVLELVGGFFIDKIFHMRFWDYSDLPFNIGGYICPLYSFFWGIIGMFFARGIHPGIARLIQWIPEPIVIVLSIAGTSVLCVDTVITVSELRKWKHVLAALSREKKALRSFSDNLGYKITLDADNLSKGVRAKELNFRYRMEELSEKSQELSARYREKREADRIKWKENMELVQKRIEESNAILSRNMKRRINAYPKLHSTEGKNYDEIIQEIKSYLNKK